MTHILIKSRNLLFLIIILILSVSPARCQSQNSLKKYQKTILEPGLAHYHFAGKKGFDSKQNINIISITLELLKAQYSLDLAWSDSTLKQTSSFADSLGGLAAINAGFFNVKDGGSVSYLEIGNEMVSRLSWKGDSRDTNSTNLNGALILNRSNEFVIEKARKSREYLNSNQEKWALVTGPILLIDSQKAELLNGSFVENKHPRTCIGITADHILLITVDGRHQKANGMTLFELQDYLDSLGCIDAINLDGGGSTTMWINNGITKMLVNCPSDNKKFDNKGERKVANALVLLSN